MTFTAQHSAKTIPSAMLKAGHQLDSRRHFHQQVALFLTQQIAVITLYSVDSVQDEVDEDVEESAGPDVDAGMCCEGPIS